MSVELLLVEDNPADAKLVLRGLKDFVSADKVHVAENGAQALEFIFGGGIEPGSRPKLVLLDLKMPKVSGIQVLEKIKSDPRTKTIPVVMLTSSSHERDLEQCYQLGANSYIVKPVDFDQFFDAMKQIGLYWLSLNRLPEQ